MNSRTVIVASAMAIVGLAAISTFTATPAAAQGGGSGKVSDVNVLNTPTVHVSTMPVVRLANEKTPFKWQQFLFIPDGGRGGVTPIAQQYVVPADKVLVLESISMDSECLDLQSVDVIGSGLAYLAVKAPDLDISGTRSVDSRTVAARFAPGTELRVSALRVGTSSTKALLVTLNGYLEPAPTTIN